MDFFLFTTSGLASINLKFRFNLIKFQIWTSCRFDWIVFGEKWNTRRTNLKLIFVFLTWLKFGTFSRPMFVYCPPPKLASAFRFFRTIRLPPLTADRTACTFQFSLSFLTHSSNKKTNKKNKKRRERQKVVWVFWPEVRLSFSLAFRPSIKPHHRFSFCSLFGIFPTNQPISFFLSFCV